MDANVLAEEVGGRGKSTAGQGVLSRAPVSKSVPTVSILHGHPPAIHMIKCKFEDRYTRRATGASIDRLGQRIPNLVPAVFPEIRPRPALGARTRGVIRT